MNDFFIGYNWPQPPGFLRAVKRAALALGVGVVGLAGALAAGHVPLEGGVFEFGRARTVTGTVVEHPYPMLRPEDGATPWPLLVSKGKHGATEAVRGLDGRRVHVQATRIARGPQTMLEIDVAPGEAGSEPLASSAAPAPGAQLVTPPAGRVILRGEIVDSKCFLGVMVPGAGTTHRDCASLCLRGGIPPALFVRDADGTSSLVLLSGPEPALRDRAAALAGEPVEVSGTIERRGGWRVLRTEPDGWGAPAR